MSGKRVWYSETMAGDMARLSAYSTTSWSFVAHSSTPMEGLPGEANCGEIDPSIALALAADPEVGPERANLMLTRESGFFGMLGWRATLGKTVQNGGYATVEVMIETSYPGGMMSSSQSNLPVTFDLTETGNSWLITSPTYIYWIY